MKSNETLSLIEKKNVTPVVIEYLKQTPTASELKEIISMLGIKAEELVRKKEELYKKEYSGKKISENEWIKILVKNPVLIERPIVVKGKKAVLGRPPENVLKLL